LRVKSVATKRERDKAVVLDVIRRLGPLSRVDVYHLTHLRPGTISLLVRELLRENKVMEVGPSDNPRGRKQILLRLNPNWGFVVAVEFDPETVVAAVLNAGADIIHRCTERTHLGGGVDGLVKQLVACAKRVMREADVDPASLVATGAADPGLIDSRAGVTVLCSTIDFWKNVPLRNIFERDFGVPFLLESNTRARVVVERILGAGQRAENMIYLDYGTGIGMGIVSQGQVLRGRSECAGEFGHTHVGEGGPACRCGSFGCLEAMAGAPAIAARARAAVLEGSASQVLELAGGDPASISSSHVLAAACAGDKMCAAILGEAEKYLGLALANAVNLFNPAVIVVDRRLAPAGEQFLEQIARIVRRQALQHATDGLAFRFAELGEKAGVLGIALLVLDDLFEIPSLKLPKFLRDAAAGPGRGLARA